VRDRCDSQGHCREQSRRDSKPGQYCTHQVKLQLSISDQTGQQRAQVSFVKQIDGPVEYLLLSPGDWAPEEGIWGTRNAGPRSCGGMVHKTKSRTPLSAYHCLPHECLPSNIARVLRPTTSCRARLLVFLPKQPRRRWNES
jgi:hypothetical protein